MYPCDELASLSIVLCDMMMTFLLCYSILANLQNTTQADLSEPQDTGFELKVFT